MRDKHLHQRVFWCYFFAFLPTALAQNAQVAPSADPRVDAAKPIAYLVVDHIGPRDPIEPGEGTAGIYLRLQNNSRLPLVVATLKDADKKASAPALLDEVIPNPKVILGGGVPWMPSPGFPSESGWDELQAYPNEDEEGVRAAEFDSQRQCGKPHNEMPAHRPSGYGWDLAPVLTVIPPGGVFFFSLPVTHVNREWHIEIPFRLGLVTTGNERPPYSYLAFFWDDLPQTYRSAHADPSSPSTPPANTLLHESGHVEAPKSQ